MLFKMKKVLRLLAKIAWTQTTKNLALPHRQKQLIEQKWRRAKKKRKKCQSYKLWTRNAELVWAALYL